MNFEIGDAVAFLHEEGKGIILQIYPDKTALIKTDEGFTIKVPLKELVHRKPKKRPKQQKQSVASSLHLPAGIYLVLDPQHAQMEYALHLINHQDAVLLFAFWHEKEGVKVYGKIPAHHSQLLWSARKSLLATPQHYHFHALCIEKAKVRYIQHTWRIASHWLQSKPLQLPMFSHPVYLRPLQEKKTTKEKPKLQEKKPSSPQPTFSSVIDLHAEKLLGTAQEDPAIIFQCQIEAFERALDQGILHQKPYLIVIHGIGNGKLKEAIHKRLRQHPYVKRFYVLHEPPFKGGATRIEIGL